MSELQTQLNKILEQLVKIFLVRVGQLNKILEQLVKIFLVRVGDPKVINIENNHDGLAVQKT